MTVIRTRSTTETFRTQKPYERTPFRMNVCRSAAAAAIRCAPPLLNATRPVRSATMRRGRSSARASSHPECPSASKIAVCLAGSACLHVAQQRRFPCQLI